MKVSDLQTTVEKTLAKQPMVPSLTNMVTMTSVANMQIAVGGSPAMFFLADEGEDLAATCDALYINLGTLMSEYQNAKDYLTAALSTQLDLGEDSGPLDHGYRLREVNDEA